MKYCSKSSAGTSSAGGSGSAPPAYRELRCLLCDHRLGGNGDRHDEHCIASALPLQVCTERIMGDVTLFTGEGLSVGNEGAVLDSALHYPELQPLHSGLPQRTLDDESCCQGCSAPALIAHVLVGRGCRTDLTFYRHAGYCLLRRVPACWILSAATANLGQPEHWCPVPLPRMHPEQAASALQAVIPEDARRCPLCSGRLAGPGGAPQHKDRCLITTAPAAVRMLTAGKALRLLM